MQNIAHLPQIILSTAFDTYTLKALESNAIDYLLKSYTKERFNQVLSKIKGGSNRSDLMHLRG